MKYKLAIIGASYLQLPLVKKANEMGIETHCFAWEEGAICKEICDFFYPISVLDKEAILIVCREIEIDGITTIATDIAIPTIAYVAEKLKLPCNSLYTAQLATNKALMRKIFEEEGISSPRFMVQKKYEEESFRDFIFPVIVKPVDRSGSRGINKIYSERDLKAAIEIAVEESFSKTAIVEEFVEGEEVSVESISWKGKHYILAITDKVTTGEPHFVELAHHQPSLKTVEIQRKLEALTIKALTSLGIEYGAGHTEIKIDSDGNTKVIEVGARMGGDFIGSHLVSLSTGYDFLRGVIEVALNEFSKPIVGELSFSGVYFLSKETQQILKYFSKPNSFDIERKIFSPEVKSIKNSNDRSGYLIYASNKKIDLL